MIVIAMIMNHILTNYIKKLNNKTSDDNDEEELLQKLEELDKRFKRLNNKKLNNEEVKIKERPNKTLEKVVKESKDLIRAIKNYDEKKERDGDNIDKFKKLLDDKENARKEYVKKTDEIFKKDYESMKKYYKDEVQNAFHTLSATPTKWSNTLKQFVGN